jgi:hypothetical protein
VHERESEDYLAEHEPMPEVNVRLTGDANPLELYGSPFGSSPSAAILLAMKLLSSPSSSSLNVGPRVCSAPAYLILRSSLAVSPAGNRRGGGGIASGVVMREDGLDWLVCE